MTYAAALGKTDPARHEERSKFRQQLTLWDKFLDIRRFCLVFGTGDFDGKKFKASLTNELYVNFNPSKKFRHLLLIYALLSFLAAFYEGFLRALPVES